MQMSEIGNSNFRIMGRLLATCEVLKDKGYFTDEDIKTKFEEIERAKEESAKKALEAERNNIVSEKEAKRDKDSGSVENTGLQSKGGGSVEDNSGNTKLPVLRAESDGGDSGGEVSNPVEHC